MTKTRVGANQADLIDGWVENCTNISSKIWQTFLVEVPRFILTGSVCGGKFSGVAERAAWKADEKAMWILARIEIQTSKLLLYTKKTQETCHWAFTIESCY